MHDERRWNHDSATRRELESDPKRPKDEMPALGIVEVAKGGDSTPAAGVVL